MKITKKEWDRLLFDILGRGGYTLEEARRCRYYDFGYTHRDYLEEDDNDWLSNGPKAYAINTAFEEAVQHLERCKMMEAAIHTVENI